MNALTHRTGYDMQAAINENIEAAKRDGHDPEECWACYDAKRQISVGSLCFMPRGCRSPESLVEITCPVCALEPAAAKPFEED